MSRPHYSVLAGGTGAAKFLRGLVQVVAEEDIHVIVNTGDDTEVWGLHVSPDIDSISYGLAKKLDSNRGWGLENESFRCLAEMEALGMPSWFRLGDRDLATHLTRTELLRQGLTLTEVVDRMARTMGILSFQEFFVRERWQPEVRSVTYAGASDAHASTAVLQSIREAAVVIIAPSNPITSIGPMLALHDLRDALRCARAEVVAISPLIGNAAVSGPAGKLMEACGYEVSPSGIARCYHDFLDNIVLDARDSALAASIRNETIGVQITDILIADDAAARRLAEFVIGVA
jgi:LPPG:FO 2-phospho-L-lactate transferase